MKRKHGSRSGYGKLLDTWVPPAEAGDSIGCVATTFTFSPAFFEEECLGRFLGLQTDAREDGAAYLLEREERLSQLECAVALVDQHYAQGTRSLRWDLLSARPVRGGILHAKVSLLLWAQHARLIVASANLTEDGYRRNQEVFAALDYFSGSDAPLTVLDEVIPFLREAVQLAPTASPNGRQPHQRWNRFLDRVSHVTREWGSTVPPRDPNQPRLFPVLTSPTRANVFETLKDRRTSGRTIDLACVISPFFDAPGGVNRPAQELWTLIKQKGSATVEYHVTWETSPDSEEVHVHAPESLLTAQPAHRSNIKTQVNLLNLEQSRPLHAKCLWLQSDDAALLMIGSSNFTAQGMGVGPVRNFEANLCFEAHRSRQAPAMRAMQNCWLPSNRVDLERVRFRPVANLDEEPEPLTPLLPKGFQEIIFCRDESQRGCLRFGFQEGLTTGWILLSEDDVTPFLGETDWQAAGSPLQWCVGWDRDRPPSGFYVRWLGSGGDAWWPVNVESGHSLPPPAELRDLPLDMLIEILTSARPLHQVVAEWRRRSPIPDLDSVGVTPLDPHKRVDTSQFLLQRTRRVSAGLSALRERLERPTASEQVLHWRLQGPIGVRALALAIEKAAQSRIEQGFLLAELCLELRRVVPQESPGCLPTETVRVALQNLADELRAVALARIDDVSSTSSGLHVEARAEMALRRYIESVFEEAK